MTSSGRDPPSNLPPRPSIQGEGDSGSFHASLTTRWGYGDGRSHARTLSPGRRLRHGVAQRVEAEPRTHRDGRRAGGRPRRLVPSPGQRRLPAVRRRDRAATRPRAAAERRRWRRRWRWRRRAVCEAVHLAEAKPTSTCS